LKNRTRCQVSLNEYTLANIFLQKPELKTAATRYVLFVGERGSDLSMIYTAGIITMLPIVILFFLLQNYFIDADLLCPSTFLMSLSHISSIYRYACFKDKSLRILSVSGQPPREQRKAMSDTVCLLSPYTFSTPFHRVSIDTSPVESPDSHKLIVCIWILPIRPVPE